MTECDFDTRRSGTAANEKPEPFFKAEPGQVWRHKNGKPYFVTGIANEGNPADDDNNPPIILYMDGEGRSFARYESGWYPAFSYLGPLSALLAAEPGFNSSQ